MTKQVIYFFLTQNSNIMKLFGRVALTTPIVEGDGDNGHWKRTTLVIETLEENRTVIPIEVFGAKRVDRITAIKVGTPIEVTFTLRGREFDGNWYLRAEYVNHICFQQTTANTTDD